MPPFLDHKTPETFSHKKSFVSRITRLKVSPDQFFFLTADNITSLISILLETFLRTVFPPFFFKSSRVRGVARERPAALPKNCLDSAPTRAGNLRAPFLLSPSKSEKRWSFFLLRKATSNFFNFSFLVTFLTLTKSHPRTSVPTLKNLLHLFVFRKFRSLFHTRSRLSLSPPPLHSHCHSPTFSLRRPLYPCSSGSGKFETNSLAGVATIIFPLSSRFRVAIEFPRHAQRNGPARRLLGAHRSSAVEDRGVPSRKVVRAICKILKNSTILPEKSIHSTTCTRPIRTANTL